MTRNLSALFVKLFIATSFQKRFSRNSEHCSKIIHHIKENFVVSGLKLPDTKNDHTINKSAKTGDSTEKPFWQFLP